MTICFFSGDITRCGGTERVSSVIANALVKKGKDEILFLSLCESGPRPGFELDERIRHFPLNDRWISPGPGYLKLIPRLRKFLRSHRVDVVIDIDIVLDVLSVWVRRRTGIKVVSWEHFNYKVEMQTLYRKVIMRLFTKRADRIVTLTGRDAEWFRQNLGEEKRICVIHNPMPEAKKGLSPKRKNQIVTVGTVNYGKGMDMLPRIAAGVLNKNPDWKWIVAGTGDMQQELAQAIKKEGLEGKVLPVGRVEDVETLLAESRLFVLTSRGEGLPMCLLEAKAYALPIVSFDIETGPDEIVTDQVNGFLIPPFEIPRMVDRINELIRDEELWQKFSENTEQKSEEFRLQTIADQWARCLDAL